jgi:hypothetical protein
MSNGRRTTITLQPDVALQIDSYKEKVGKMFPQAKVQLSDIINENLRKNPLTIPMDVEHA